VVVEKELAWPWWCAVEGGACGLAVTVVGAACRRAHVLSMPRADMAMGVGVDIGIGIGIRIDTGVAEQRKARRMCLQARRWRVPASCSAVVLCCSARSPCPAHAARALRIPTRRKHGACGQALINSIDQTDYFAQKRPHGRLWPWCSDVAPPNHASAPPAAVRTPQKALEPRLHGSCQGRGLFTYSSSPRPRTHCTALHWHGTALHPTPPTPVLAPITASTSTSTSTSPFPFGTRRIALTGPKHGLKRPTHPCLCRCSLLLRAGHRAHATSRRNQHHIVPPVLAARPSRCPQQDLASACASYLACDSAVCARAPSLPAAPPAPGVIGHPRRVASSGSIMIAEPSMPGKLLYRSFHVRWR
jgi:hypothetical protein